MKKLVLLLTIGHFALLMNAQIIADHSSVDEYDDIPEEYLDMVKTMLVDISGESHSLGYRIGMNLLESMDNSYMVETYSNESPPAKTDQYLRLGRHITMGEDYFFSQSKIADLKASITSQKNTGNPFDVMGFGWCWDMTWKNAPGGAIDPVHNVHWAGSSVGGPDGSMRWGLDSDDVALTGNSVSMDTYLEAVESYIEYCTTNGYPTTWIFTTGPVDGNSGTENGFQREIKHDYIRDYVAEDDSRILFDYADILCWNNSGEQNLGDWNDGGTIRSHAQIHSDNMMDYDNAWNTIAHSEDGDHIGEVGAVRIAKAMWWMLARMAGWEGVPVLLSDIAISPEGGLGEVPFGESLQYTVQVAPENASNKDVSWSVLALSGMASISSTGLLKAEGPGLVSVVATALDGSGVSDTLQLTILEPPVQVAVITIFSEGEVEHLMTGETLQYTVEVMPEDAANKEVDWSVVNGTGTASISQNGLFTGGVPGSVAILAMARDGSGVSDTSFLNITPPLIPVTNIDITSANESGTLASGSTLQFSATVLPAEANNKEIDWSVVDGTGSASITATGLLTAHNPGTVTVVATARDGTGVNDSFLLSVTTPMVMVTSITVSSSGGVSELVSGATLQFSATVLPAEAINKEIDWSVENGTGSASITASGMLISGIPGNISVVASAKDGSGVKDTFDLVISTPVIEVESITIDSKDNVTMLEEGEMLQLFANVSPSNADNTAVLWHVTSTKGTGAGSITADGMFIAIAQGEVDVVAIAQDGSGVYGMLNLTVLGPSVIEENGSESVMLFPNPGLGLFFLNVGDLKVEQLKVFDVNGGIVLERLPEPGQQVIELDLSNQSAGFYFIKIFSTNHSLVKRAIISN